MGPWGVERHVAAVDWLEYGGAARWKDVESFERWFRPGTGKIVVARETARACHEAMPVYVLGPDRAPVFVEPAGKPCNAGYVYLPIKLTYKGCTVAVEPHAQGSDERPNVYVQMPGEALLLHGAKRLWGEVRELVGALGADLREEDEFIRRGDVCLDLVGFDPRQWWAAMDADRVVTRCHRYGVETCGRNVKSGFTAGSGGRVLLRVYDKAMELLAGQKSEAYVRAWIDRRAGGVMPKHAVRIEFQNRTEWLRENGVRTVADFFRLLPAIVGRLTRDVDPFFKLTSAAVDRNHNQKRAGVDPSWAWACQVFRELAGEVVDQLQKIKRGAIDAKRACQQAAGCVMNAAIAQGFHVQRVADLVGVFNLLLMRNGVTDDQVRERWDERAGRSGLLEELLAFP